MKPHPRIRKTVKWAGAVLSVLLVVVWVGSARWVGGLPYHGGPDVSVAEGQLWIVLWDPRDAYWHGVHWNEHPDCEPFYWWFDVDLSGRSQVVRIPLWVFAVPVLVATTAAWRLDTLARRRFAPGHCSKCGYNLSATPATEKCPECGAGTSKTRPHAG